MDSKISEIVQFMERGDVRVVGISMAVDVQTYLFSKAALVEDKQYRINKFCGHATSVNRLLPKGSMRILFWQRGIYRQKVIYNIGEG